MCSDCLPFLKCRLILTCYIVAMNESCRIKVLQYWKNKEAFAATYENLLKLFVAAGHDAGALAVCAALNAHKK